MKWKEYLTREVCRKRMPLPLDIHYRVFKPLFSAVFIIDSIHENENEVEISNLKSIGVIY